MIAVDQAAPERVFIVWPSDNECGLAFTVPSKSGQMRTEYIRSDLAAPSALDDWREIEQGYQPRLSEGYTAVRVSKPGFWFVHGAGPASAQSAPSAPAEVEGLVERLRDNATLDECEGCNPDVVALEREAATALTAQQAEIERLRNWQDHNANEVPRLQMRLDAANARAEKAEAERDELISVISDEISRSRRHLSAATLAAYAKLKGEA